MSALTGLKEFKLGSAITTSFAKVLDQPVDWNFYDLQVMNTDASATVTICFADTLAEAGSSNISTFDVPPSTGRTIRNIPSNVGKNVYGKASAATSLVLISQVPPSDASGR